MIISQLFCMTCRYKCSKLVFLPWVYRNRQQHCKAFGRNARGRDISNLEFLGCQLLVAKNAGKQYRSSYHEHMLPRSVWTWKPGKAPIMTRPITQNLKYKNCLFKCNSYKLSLSPSNVWEKDFLPCSMFERELYRTISDDVGASAKFRNPALYQYVDMLVTEYSELEAKMASGKKGFCLHV